MLYCQTYVIIKKMAKKQKEEPYFGSAEWRQKVHEASKKINLTFRMQRVRIFGIKMPLWVICNDPNT